MRMIDALADVFLGAACPGCDRAGLGLCQDCAGQVARPRLVRPVPGSVALPMTVLGAHAWVLEAPVVALARYDGPAGRAMVALKEHQAWSVARQVAPGLALAVQWVVAQGSPLGQAARAGPVVLVPVPSSPAAVRQRGFDHGRALARQTARRTGLPARALLRRSRRTLDQAGAGRAERGTNQRGSMRVLPARPSSIVLVDDICTTGQTLIEATRSLHRAGHQVLGAVVVCDTTLRQASPDRGGQASGDRGRQASGDLGRQASAGGVIRVGP